MYDREGSAADVLDVDDAAVRRCTPPQPVWVDLAALTKQRERGGPYGQPRPGGVYIEGVVRGMMWAQVMTQRGIWLGAITCELERGGRPVMTVEALVPEWAVERRLPGSARRTYGKTSNRLGKDPTPRTGMSGNSSLHTGSGR